jgi:hypothetical protein
VASANLVGAGLGDLVGIDDKRTPAGGSRRPHRCLFARQGLLTPDHHHGRAHRTLYRTTTVTRAGQYSVSRPSALTSANIGAAEIRKGRAALGGLLVGEIALFRIPDSKTGTGVSWPSKSCIRTLTPRYALPPARSGLDTGPARCPACHGCQARAAPARRRWNCGAVFCQHQNHQNPSFSDRFGDRVTNNSK